MQNMKNQSKSKFIIRSGLTLALALVFWSPVQAQPTEPAKGKMMMEGQMKERCQEMKAKKEKMMAEMKAQDAELTAQVARMNSAPENEKSALMAALITQLAEQRVTMDARRAKMEEEMMKHMMQHMQMGKESMAQCPMMKGMGDMDAKSDSTHEEHPEMEKK
jgi:hypothetical protein